jgi:hypothetical protein
MKEIDPVVSASQAFIAANPDYRRDSKTASEMVDYIVENDLPQTDAESWQKAYDAVCRDSVGYATGKFLEDGTNRKLHNAELVVFASHPHYARRNNDILFVGQCYYRS